MGGNVGRGLWRSTDGVKGWGGEGRIYVTEGTMGEKSMRCEIVSYLFLHQIFLAVYYMPDTILSAGQIKWISSYFPGGTKC